MLLTLSRLLDLRVVGLKTTVEMFVTGHNTRSPSPVHFFNSGALSTGSGCWITSLAGTVDVPVGWGSTYFYTDVRVGVGVLVLFWEACFCFHRTLAFDISYDLDLCSQGQAARAFIIGMDVSLFLSKVQGGF